MTDSTGKPGASETVMRKSRRFIFFVISILLITSCSVQKRRYQSGFYVDWNQTKKENALSKEKAARYARPADLVSPEQLEASAAEELPSAIRMQDPPPDSCDILLYRDGSEIAAKVMEVSPEEIKYKRCDNLGGPTYVSRKTELFMIKYSNGSREVIKVQEPPRQTPVSREPGRTPTRKFRRVVPPSALVSVISGGLSLLVGYVGLIVALAFFSFEPALIVLFITAILALIAVISGRNAMNKINDAPEVYKGKGNAVTGQIFGYIVLGILALIGLLFFLSI